MVDEGWADTPEGGTAFDWVKNYVYGLLRALDDGGLIEARNITAPGFVVEGLQGLGVSDSVMQRTTDLARQAHACLNSRPPDDSGAWNAVHAIGRLWGVH